MPHSARIDWLPRQMYSREAPIGRDQIFAAFGALLEGIAGRPADAPVQTRSEDLPGMDHLGYWAARLGFELRAGDATLLCDLHPILATMGVSGETHSWWDRDLPGGIRVRGTAKSSARQPSHAEVTVEGVEADRARELLAAWRAAFPRILTAKQLERELG